MSATGKWTVTIKSPMGEGPATIDLTEEGGSISGVLSGAQGDQAFEGGTADGNSLAWSFDVTTPMAMKVECTAEVDGDAITGGMKFGAMGSATFAGTRG